MHTTIKHDPDTGGTCITVVETGQTAVLYDVGRCYRLAFRGEFTSSDVSNALGWTATLNRIRRLLRNKEA